MTNFVYQDGMDLRIKEESRIIIFGNGILLFSRILVKSKKSQVYDNDDEL